MQKCVVLLSGGIDSAVVSSIAKSNGFSLYCLTVNYGQRHSREIVSAKKIAKFLNAKKHIILDIDLRKLLKSALTSNIKVPKNRSKIKIKKNIPVTYVPARNTIFLSLALGWAESLSACDIFIGVNSIDYSGYPDCRGEYIKFFEKLANIATKVGVNKLARFKINTPLLHLNKSDIIRRGAKLGMDFSLTWSCYAPVNNSACGRCDACRFRLGGFKKAGLNDPIKYHKV